MTASEHDWEEREEVRQLRRELERVRRERGTLGRSSALLLAARPEGTGESHLLVRAGEQVDAGGEWLGRGDVLG